MGTGLIGVHEAEGLVLVGPVAVVTGGHAHDDAGLGKLFHDPVHKRGALLRIFMGGDKAGIGGAQGQVHRVAAQNHSVLHSSHVVAGVSAALLAEDLHGDELCVGSHAGDAHGLGGGDVQGTVLLIALQLVQEQVDVIGGHAAVAAEVGILGAVNFGPLHHVVHEGLGIGLIQVAVAVEVIDAGVLGGDVVTGGGDTGHVRAVLTLLVVVMGHIQVAVDVVEDKGQLAVQVQVLSSEVPVPLGHMELAQDPGNLLGVHQVQRGHVVLQAHPLLLCLELQGILPGGVREGLVVRIRAGVHHGNPGPCAGVAGVLLHAGGAGHLLGHHIAGVGLGHGLIPGLQIHGLHTGHLTDFLQLAIGHVGRNGVGRQGQVPDHVQGLPGQALAGDPAGHLLLGPVQLLTVLDGRLAGEGLAGGLHDSQGGVLLQDNHSPDQFGCFIGLGAVQLDRVALGVYQLRRDLAGVQLLEGHGSGSGFHRVGAAQVHAANQGGNQNQSQHALQTGMLHDHSSFLILKCWQTFSPHTG